MNDILLIYAIPTENENIDKHGSYIIIKNIIESSSILKFKYYN